METKFDKSVSLVCWAYNEELLIEEFLDRAWALMEETVEDFEIVLIDDCSTDKTPEILKKIQESKPQIKVYRNEQNLNVGISCRRAIQKASKEYLFWQTIDWSYDISELRSHLELLKEVDIVQGVRRRPVKIKLRLLKPVMFVLKHFGTPYLTRRSDTVGKAVVSLLNYSLIRTLFNVPISDYQNVTIYPSKWIQSIELEAKSSFLNPEMLLKSYWAGKSFKEVPISFCPRTKGEAKGTRFAAIKTSVLDILGLWFKWMILGGRGKVTAGTVDRLPSHGN